MRVHYYKVQKEKLTSTPPLKFILSRLNTSYRFKNLS